MQCTTNSTFSLAVLLHLIAVVCVVPSSLADDDARLVYDSKTIKHAVAALRPPKNRVLVALYSERLSPQAQELIRKSARFNIAVDGREYSPTAYFHLEFAPGTDEITLSKVRGYTLEFNRDPRWFEYWKNSDPPANVNWAQPLENGAPDLSVIKHVTGKFKLGTTVGIHTAGERSLTHLQYPTFEWDIVIDAKILFSDDYP